MARDWHDFLNVAWQTVDVRKACKMVMKIESVYNTTYNTHIKNFRTFDHEKNWIEKIAKHLSNSIISKICLYRNKNSEMLLRMTVALTLKRHLSVPFSVWCKSYACIFLRRFSVIESIVIFALIIFF